MSIPEMTADLRLYIEWHVTLACHVVAVSLHVLGRGDDLVERELDGARGRRRVACGCRGRRVERRRRAATGAVVRVVTLATCRGTLGGRRRLWDDVEK